MVRENMSMFPYPDIFVAHDIEMLPTGVKLSKKLGIPLVYDAHEDWPLLVSDNSRLEAMIADFIETRSSRYLSHVFVPSQNLAQRFRRMGVPATVLYNSPSRLQAYALDRDETRAAFGYAKDDFVVGLIGNLEQRTDLTDVLLATLHQLPDRYKLLIVGGPNEIADEIRFRAYQQGFAGRIHVTGQLLYEAVRPRYSVLDLGLVLMDRRRAFVASLPNKVFSYMAHCVPILAPGDYPEIAKVIHDSACGYLCGSDSFTAEDLHLLIEAVAKRGDGERRGWNGRLAYLQRYAWEKQAPKFVKICEQAVAPRPRRLTDEYLNAMDTI
jgi:glycosyltransferase involved in cell wall biosynthesis